MNAPRPTSRPLPPERPQHEPPATPDRRDGEQAGKSGSDMVAMARDNERFHLAPALGATEPQSDPFPRPVVVGLVLGVVGGGVLGLGFATLLLNGTIVVPGWEQLAAMAPGIFSTFWIGIGLAIGGFIGGVGAIRFTPVDRRPEPVATMPHPHDAAAPPVENGA